MRIYCVVILLLGWLVGGCSEPRPAISVAGIADEDNDIKIPAIKKAVRENDRTALGPLVGQLESDDAAVRFYAIWGLEKLTSQRLGYEYYHDEEQRKDSVARLA